MGSGYWRHAVRLEINLEVRHGASSRITFLRRAKTESLPRPAADLRGDPIAVVLGERGPDAIL